MTDFNKILDKAKELESKMRESQEKIKNISATGISGGNLVKIKLNGEGEIIDIHISPEILKEEKTVLLTRTCPPGLALASPDMTEVRVLIKFRTFRIQN